MSESREFGQTILYELPNFKGTGIGFGKVGYGYDGAIPSQLLNTVGSLKIGPETEVILKSVDGASILFQNKNNYIKKINSIVGDNSKFISLVVNPIHEKLVFQQIVSQEIEGFANWNDFNKLLLIMVLSLLIMIIYKHKYKN